MSSLKKPEKFKNIFCMILLNIHGWLTIEWEIHITFYLSFHIVFVSADIQYKNHLNILVCIFDYLDDKMDVSICVFCYASYYNLQHHSN